MTIRVYNTLNRKKEPFEPLEPGKVRMYVCGPTVYDSCHIGHARSVVVFDVIARYLRASGLQVTYVRNFTDVDDKIIRRAEELKLAPEALAAKYIDEFYQDMDQLNVERASIEPKATEHIDHIIAIIERLMAKSLAYQIDGDVFFAVDRFPEYGKLSGRRLEDMEAGARVDVDLRKRNPMDFALWKTAKPGEPAWESPWGKGRPGWHIECSAMSSCYLGESFDIHGGGKDLIFPHHENEIAQSEGAHAKRFVKYWIHNGFVNINQEKMSKSLGNFLLIKDILQHYHPEAVRLFLLSNHYRSPIDFNQKAMAEALASLDKIYATLARLQSLLDNVTTANADLPAGKAWQRFREAMDDDFNTARGVGILFETVRQLNRIMDESQEQLIPQAQQRLRTEWHDLVHMGQVLGIMDQDPNIYFEHARDKALKDQAVDPAEIERLVAARNEARRNKDWAEADQIRDQLAQWRVILEDRPDGTVWKFDK